MYYSILDVYEYGEVPEYVELDYKGFHVLALKTEYGFILERLFSTNPKAFLSTELLPGSLLQNNLIKARNQWYNKRCMHLPASILLC